METDQQSVQERLPLNDPEAVARVRAQLEEMNVEYIASVWVDTFGRAKAKIVPRGGFEKVLEGRGPLYGVHALEGMGSYGAADPDQTVIPDLSTLTICPWDTRIAWFAGDIHWVGGGAYPLDSRAVLKRQLDRARGLGYDFKVGIEPEFYVYKENGGYHDLQPLNDQDFGQSWAYDVDTTIGGATFPFLSDVTSAFESLGWEVGALVHEGGISQYEIDYGYDNALVTADRWVFVKELLRQVARRHDAFVSFMPKPSNGAFRSGLHYNMSLWTLDGEDLIGDDGTGDGRISRLASQFIAGQLKHAAAITAVTCPNVNSYRGLVLASDVGGIASDKSWAPVVVTYGPNNRSAMIRVPDGRSCIENRATDSSCNIYLGLAMSLGAALDGIENGLEPPEPFTASAYTGSESALKKFDVPRLPRSLDEALDELEADPLVREVLGSELADAYVELKRGEWDDYLRHVSEWDRERYLRQF
ncbi:MAG: glutamine synthetase [Solirubrobacteraceae bacterium]|nr:glutamine synthetase [Solirubrobacteraceae bacterium]MEA2290376.1 glutamine synthetase [Solirubrobacteraceae bacterium]